MRKRERIRERERERERIREREREREKEYEIVCSWSSHPWQNNLLGEQFLREGERYKARRGK